jgi:hypothetical protein
MKLYKSTYKKRKKTDTNPKLPDDSKTVQSVSKYFLDFFFTLPPHFSETVSHFGNGACLMVFHVEMGHFK